MRRLIKVGVRCAKTFTIWEKDVAVFGELIGDNNPIHTDLSAAKAAGFNKCPCHGMLIGSLVSGLMATELPGPNTVYIRQNFRFVSPVFVGDTVCVSLEVHQFRKNRGLLALKTIVEKEIDTEASKKSVLCIDGMAVGINKTVIFEGESDWTVSV